MNSDTEPQHSSGPDGTPATKRATKIRIIEDAEATGETAALTILAGWVGETADSRHDQVLLSSA